MIKNLISCFVVLTLSLSTYAQTKRGLLLADSLPQSIVKQFYLEDHINLDSLRALTNFITNRDITHFQNFQIPKRKKAVLRHVKQISEQLENSYLNGESRNANSDEKIYELVLISNALKQKTIEKSYVKVPRKEKLSMYRNTVRSKWFFKYSIPNNPNLPANVPLQNSPYYHRIRPDTPMHKQFAYLAKQKNIKIKKDMVLIFKQFSLSGSAPKVQTLDIDMDNEWMLKWGDEVHTDVVGSRIFAALGYDVDHPYFFGKDKITLVFEHFSEVNSTVGLVNRIHEIYGIDIKPFISSSGKITKEMATNNNDLSPFLGQHYVRFLKCFIEARPDRVKRIGSYLPYDELNEERVELKGALLAHHFIGNWDTREASTLLTTVHDGNYNYRISAVFSDLGTSLGVDINTFPPDFKVGLVNCLPWDAVERKNNKIKFNNQINGILPSYENASYNDLLWMANEIAKLDGYNLKKIIDKAHWPKPIAQLYFHKLASRRASILAAFNIKDPHPIDYDRNISITYKGLEVVKNGVLIVDFIPENPESFISKIGRFRNYGN